MRTRRAYPIPRRGLILGAAASLVALPAAAERLVDKDYAGRWRCVEQSFGAGEHIGAVLLLKPHGHYNWESPRASAIFTRENYGNWQYDTELDQMVLISRGLIGRMLKFRREANLWRAFANARLSGIFTNPRRLTLEFTTVGGLSYDPELQLVFREVATG